MINNKIKNLILLISVLVCIVLSSRIWLQLPNFLNYNSEKNEMVEETELKIDFWSLVKPVKAVIKFNENYTILYSAEDKELWKKTIEIIDKGLSSKSEKINISNSAAFPINYFKFDFATSIPIEIFEKQMEINNVQLNDKVPTIKNIILDLDNKNTIYFYDGKDTIKVESEDINTEEVAKIIKELDYSKYPKYSTNEKIGDQTIKIPVPLETTVKNPIFVQSELDVFDTEAINKIAKDYFKSDYDYVRKAVEVSGNRVFMYRTEKVLKVNSEGQLDFYDSNIESDSNIGEYESLLTALKFTEDFLGFPQEGFLSNIETVQYEGNFGYRFIFSYKLQNRPLLFSRVRPNAALQIDVVGNKVVSYKRFIRDIDETQKDKMLNYEILPAVEVIEKNMQTDIAAANNLLELKPIKAEKIKDINNIYLGYFDLSRISKEQVLRVVWVVEMKDKTYIFNAITGALIEEW